MSVGTRRVLVVDDSRTQLAMIADFLEAQGLAVLTAGTGEEALALLGREPVDCVLLDMTMPGLGGEETCRRLKADPALREIAVVMMTSREETGAVLDALSAGADDFVGKSSDPAVLLARVNAQLRRREQEQEHRAVRERLARSELEAAQASAERELARTRERLLRDLERKHEELQRSQLEREKLLQELQGAVIARDDFLSIASHELKTPLTSLRMVAQALEGNAPAPMAPRLANITRQTRRLVRLIDNLLDVSRIASRRLELEREQMDLADLVRELADGDALPAGGSPVQLDLEPAVGFWDPIRMEQVVANLLSNAAKYGAGAPIEVSVQRRGDLARLRVRDHGIGIGEEHQRRIFERFERAVSTRHYGGFGLGLWIAREIVEGHGGTIDVKSEPGRGSTFTVELPMRPPS